MIIEKSVKICDIYLCPTCLLFSNLVFPHLLSFVHIGLYLDIYVVKLDNISPIIALPSPFVGSLLTILDVGLTSKPCDILTTPIWFASCLLPSVGCLVLSGNTSSRCLSSILRKCGYFSLCYLDAFVGLESSNTLTTTRDG